MLRKAKVDVGKNVGKGVGKMSLKVSVSAVAQ